MSSQQKKMAMHDIRTLRHLLSQQCLLIYTQPIVKRRHTVRTNVQDDVTRPV
jgi:hypothetical protein